MRTDSDGKTEVLLVAPSFFGYGSMIAEELVRQGYNVYVVPDRISESSISKGFFRFFGSSAFSMAHNAQTRRLDGVPINPSIVIVIQGETWTERLVAWCRGQWPSAEFVFYTWDNVKNKPYAPSLAMLFDRAYSFDGEDAARHEQFTLLPLFFESSPADAESTVGSIDLSFTGTLHSDRLLVCRALLSDAPLGANINFELYVPSDMLLFLYTYVTRTISSSDMAWVSSRQIPYKVFKNILGLSRAVLDIHHPNQTGLTMRTIEVLSMGKKLVTTNHSIRYYDLYDEHRVFLLDRINPVFPPLDWIREPVHPISESVIQKYSIDRFVMTLVGE